MQILINLKVRWSGSDTIIIPPVITEPPVITDPITPPSSDVIDITNLWYSTFSKGYGELVLESGKTYSLNTVKTININGVVKIKTTGAEPAYLWIGKAMYILFVDSGEDSVLFHLLDGADVHIDNIWASIREQERNVQQMYSVNWFSSVQDANAKWRALVSNCDTTYLGKNGGLGTGLLYGGIHENYVGLVNYKHSGPMITELKNPWENGVMYLVMDNVTTDYTDPYEWSRRAHLTKGNINNSNVLSLTGDIETTCLYNHFFINDKGANRSFLVHIGRFTFMVDTIDSEINRKQLQLRPSPKNGGNVLVKPILEPVLVDEKQNDGTIKKVHKKDLNGNLLYFKKSQKVFFGKTEPHAGDSFSINQKSYTIISKDKTEWDEWTNNWGAGQTPLTTKAPQCNIGLDINLNDGTTLVDNTLNYWIINNNNGITHTIENYQSTFNLYGLNEEIYLIYKDDMFFNTTINTKFGDWRVLQARGGAHMVYNHRQISIWAKDVDLNSGIPEGNDDPYYRESTNGLGKSLGYNLVNCTGFDDEFNGANITTDKLMPDRIKSLL